MKAFRAATSVGLLVAVAAGCTPLKPAYEPLSGDVISVSIEDDPEHLRFNLVLKSNVAESVCIDADAWPSATGQIGFGGHRARLLWNGGELPAREGMQDYCPGGCELRIAPNVSIEAKLRYEEFGDPTSIAALAGKRLELIIKPFRCARRRQAG